MPTSPDVLRDLARPHALTHRALQVVEKFLHVEAISGLVLLCAAIGAMVWANSPWSASYSALWHAPVTLGIADWTFTRSLHFWVNDILMAVFFLVVGMEIRREIHEGALADARSAALPLAAALGGVVVPALIYLGFNTDASVRHGWAVPMATDIAFAVGVLALLGRSIPSNIRIFLLALAIIDDIIAVLVIALFYSGGLQPDGALWAALGIAAVMALQMAGIGTAWAYVVPSVVVWIGFYRLGVHPTLAGVVLGLMTPVRSVLAREPAMRVARDAVSELDDRSPAAASMHSKQARVRELGWAQREMLAPVTRIQALLHPWVAFCIMPIFAFANAGIPLGGIDFAHPGAPTVLMGVIAGLVLGKPVGIVMASWLAVQSGLCRLPTGVTWSGVLLVGMLAGIGFTMAIFIAMLGFNDEALLGTAKLGVLMASVASALIGLSWGYFRSRSMRVT